MGIQNIYCSNYNNMLQYIVVEQQKGNQTSNIVSGKAAAATEKKIDRPITRMNECVTEGQVIVVYL